MRVEEAGWKARPQPGLTAPRKGQTPEVSFAHRDKLSTYHPLEAASQAVDSGLLVGNSHSLGSRCGGYWR